MSVQYVVIEGRDGEALQQRQVAAIRRALAWFVAHPESDDRADTE